LTLGEAPKEDAAFSACVFVSSGGSSPRGWPFIVKCVDGALWCTTYTNSAKMRWIAEADQATCLVFANEFAILPYWVVDGTVEVVRATPELVSRWCGRPIDDLGGIRVADRLLSGKRVFLCVRPIRPPLVFQGQEPDADG